MIVKLEMISGRGYKLNVGPDHVGYIRMTTAS